MDRRRTDYSGAYWPAKVVDRNRNRVIVQYDDDDSFEHVYRKNMNPLPVPVDFGQEKTKLAVGWKMKFNSSTFGTRKRNSAKCLMELFTVRVVGSGKL